MKVRQEEHEQNTLDFINKQGSLLKQEILSLAKSELQKKIRIQRNKEAEDLRKERDKKRIE